jgi:hypothetical protein
MGKHVDQPIDTEEFDTPTDQVTDAWLRDAEELGTSGLGELAALEDAPYLHHQFGAKPQVFRLFWGEPDIAEHVATGALNFRCHVGYLLERERMRSRNRC